MVHPSACVVSEVGSGIVVVGQSNRSRENLILGRNDDGRQDLYRDRRFRIRSDESRNKVGR